MSKFNSYSVNLSPQDEHNEKLVNYVHPENWVNPNPAPCYDLVVIGAGTGGLVVAAGTAGLGLGLKVALVEKYLMGGDCLNFGCVPSKAIIRSARVIGEFKKAQELGIGISDELEVDFSAIMARMRQIRAEISHHDSAARFKNLGVDVFFGSACFSGNNSIQVGGQILSYKKAVIATGARASQPQIQGIETVGFHTNETIFSLTELPSSLAVIGAGPIGCELAQTFYRFGANVTLFHKYHQILNKEDIEASKIIQNQFQTEGINLILNAQIIRVEPVNKGKKIYYKANSEENTIVVADILISTGRMPNVEGLNLEAVGVKYDRNGIQVNDYLETTNPQIYAVGDICLKEKFTHTADASARIVIKNALFSPFGLGKAKFSDLIIPRVTYTDPEVAHVGIDEDTAQEKGLKFNTIKVNMNTVDRAITDNETEGFVKVIHEQKSDHILGATIIAPHAGEMISEITSAMVNNIGLNGLSKVIHAYPTQADAIKKVADAYRRTLLTPTSQKLLKILTRLS